MFSSLVFAINVLRDIKKLPTMIEVRYIWSLALDRLNEHSGGHAHLIYRFAKLFHPRSFG